MNSFHILNSDVLIGLAQLEAGSVQTCVTSPPYFGLRDYRVAGQIGLEKRPDAYVARLVDVFREVRRVLRDDGTLWLNLGDSYSQRLVGPRSGGTLNEWKNGGRRNPEIGDSPIARQTGLKPKNLIGIPWRVAFALQADGWYLRCDIIWHKPNPMPESVRDRPTKAHEYVFLLAKSKRYFYDADAVREPVTGRPRSAGKNSRIFVDRDPAHLRYGSGNKARRVADGLERGRVNSHLGSGVPWQDNGTGRNRRDVWTLAGKPFKGAHFAVMPEALVEPCILAGSRPGDLVLDPFAGSGTVGVVSLRHGRRFVGTELNPEYCALAESRILAAAA